jgi:hypothetical protein
MAVHAASAKKTDVITLRRSCMFHPLDAPETGLFCAAWHLIAGGASRLIWIKGEDPETSYAQTPQLLGRNTLVKKISMLGASLVAAAVLCAAPISVQWSQQKGLSVSQDSAYARVGRPLTATSVAGVARRTGRRAVRRCAAGVTCY